MLSIGKKILGIKSKTPPAAKVDKTEAVPQVKVSADANAKFLSDAREHALKLNRVLDTTLTKIEDQMLINNKGLKVPNFELRKIIDEAKKEALQVVN